MPNESLVYEETNQRLKFYIIAELISFLVLQEACIFVAVSIHYFYLAGFAWMLMEGAYLYLMVVKVYNAVVRMKLIYAFSWGRYPNHYYSSNVILNA